MLVFALVLRRIVTKILNWIKKKKAGLVYEWIQKNVLMITIVFFINFVGQQPVSKAKLGFWTSWMPSRLILR